MRDPFRYPLEPMTGQQAQAAQKEREAQRSWKVTSSILLVLAFGVYLFMMYGWPMLNAQEEDLGGEEGVLQDGVYYIYAGGGMALPDEVRVPRGIFAYTPGEEPEELVSTEEHRLDVLFPSWDVNSHGLYFVDLDTNVLYRMDLATRAVTELYALPEAPKGTNPYLFPNGLWEDRIALICHDGVLTYHLTLDCRTGEVLSREEDDQRKGWTMTTGERILEQYQVDYPPGTEYPDWEWDMEHGHYTYTDLRENGVSVLPPGHKLEEVESRVIGDAVLVISYPFEDMGDWTYQLFLADGRTLDLPEDTEDVWRQYLAVSGTWLFYAENRAVEKNGVVARRPFLQAMDLTTGETYLVQEGMNCYRAVTDGTWFYTYGDQTNCYKLEYTPEGVPCGLTLVEERI